MLWIELLFHHSLGRSKKKLEISSYKFLLGIHGLRSRRYETHLNYSKTYSWILFPFTYKKICSWLLEFLVFVVMFVSPVASNIGTVNMLTLRGYF